MSTMTLENRITNMLLAGGFTGATRFTDASEPAFAVSGGTAATVILSWDAGAGERAGMLARYEKCLTAGRLKVENRGDCLYVRDPQEKTELPPDPDRETITVYVSVGNSDDQLTQSAWSTFTASVRDVLRKHASTVHGEWYSAPDAPYQNACFCAEFTSRAGDLLAKLSLVRMQLDRIRHDWQQDSIAWALAETEFITAPHATEAPCFAKGHEHR